MGEFFALKNEMFPLKVCGLWYLVYSTNPVFLPRTELKVEYNRIEVVPFKEYGVFTWKKRVKGALLVPEEGVTRVAWSNKVVHEFDTYLLPPIQFPGQDKTKSCLLNYEVDPMITVLTLHDGTHDYVFHRQTPTNEKDTFIKLLFTQLLVDQIMKHF